MIRNTFHVEEEKKVRHRHTKIIRHADMPPEICAPLDSVSQILQRSRNRLKILGARKRTRRKFHAEDQQILSATAQNSESVRPGARALLTPEV